MSSYSDLIGQAIRRDNPATLAVVEEIMRTERTGLDGLTKARFDHAARLAYADVQLLAAAGMLADYCDALGLDMPASDRKRAPARPLIQWGAGRGPFLCPWRVRTCRAGRR